MKEEDFETTQTSVASPYKPETISWKLLVLVVAAFVALLLVSWKYQTIIDGAKFVYANVGKDFELFLLAGFVAQLIDGALGMAYGVTASTFLLSFGVTPAAASASIHTSEIFT